jgi:hypothetical protein
MSVDYARMRVPQRFIESSGIVPPMPLRACPLRPEKDLFADEGPHAISWLAFRGDTVRLRYAA